MVKTAMMLLSACLATAWLSAEPIRHEHMIEWKGSAYEDGDAFIVTAKISEKAVDLTWDGFAGTVFDFMDEREKEKTQQSFRFEDPATVDAFRSIARYSEWADVGGPTALGQGISVEVEIRDDDEKLVRSMYYFGTRPKHVIAKRFQRVPWELKKLVSAKDQPEEKARFSNSLIAFAGDLSSCGKCLSLIEKAYHEKGVFPHSEFARLARVPTYEEFNTLYGNEFSPNQSKVDALLGIVGEALKDSLDPSRRMALLGKGLNDGGCLVQIDIMSRGYEDSVTAARLPKSSNSPHYRMISNRAEELLLRFISGGQEIGNYPAPLSCRIKYHRGILSIEEGDLWFGKKQLELDPEMKRRLSWLNKEQAFQQLGSKLKGGLDEMNGLVHFSAIRVHPHDNKRVKFDYSFNGNDSVVEARLEDGIWTPGKRWSWREYYLIDGVHHNSTHFRD